MYSNIKKFYKIPVFSNADLFEENIAKSIIDFVKLITVTEQGSFKADPLFGFRVLDYEFSPNVDYYLRQDLQPIIQNKIPVFDFLAQQIQDRLFHYLPDAKDLVRKIEIKPDDQTQSKDVLQQKISVTIHFKPPESVSYKNREVYKISLNTLRTIT